MRYFYIVLILFSQIYIQATAATENIDFAPLYYNVLDLNKEQIPQFDNGNENILDKRQKAQYRILKHLERHEKKQKTKDYYKSNPRMSVFGDYKKK